MRRIASLTAGLVPVLIAGAAAAAAGSASSSLPGLEKAFSGTIVSTYPDGRTAHLWMNRNGTYTSEGRRHDRHAGTWRVQGAKVCFKRGMFGYCTAVPTDGEFTTKAVTGETIRVRLIPGRGGESGG
jgi:hypothetical protein